MEPHTYLPLVLIICLAIVANILARRLIRRQAMRIVAARLAEVPKRPQTAITIERDAGLLWMQPLTVVIDRRKVGVPGGNQTLRG